MSKPVLQPVNLGSIAHGVLMELFELEIAKIAANIDDKNTKATAKRKVTFELIFAPDADRRAIDVTTRASLKLAGIADHASRVYLGKDTANDIYGARDTMLTAQCPAPDAFVFDQYYSDPAKFIIGLKVAFLQTDELLYLIRVASNLKAGNSVSAQDDGFSQTITLKAGEVSTAEVKIKPRIKLIPIRSFSELYFAEGGRAVESDFLIRFKQTPDQTPSIALFNVDGTRWQGEIMRSIKDYLAKNLPEGLPILA